MVLNHRLNHESGRIYRTKHKETELLYGRSEHQLVQLDGHWRIAKKKILLLNDTMPAMVDFYSL